MKKKKMRALDIMRSSGLGSLNKCASVSSDQTLPLKQKIYSVDNLFITNYN